MRLEIVDVFLFTADNRDERIFAWGGELMAFSEKLMDLETLEMSNKRNHKVMITDEAIEKVPFIWYKEIPEEEYPIIQMLAKKYCNCQRMKMNLMK